MLGEAGDKHVPQSITKSTKSATYDEAFLFYLFGRGDMRGNWHGGTEAGCSSLCYRYRQSTVDVLAVRRHELPYRVRGALFVCFFCPQKLDRQTGLSLFFSVLRPHSLRFAGVLLVAGRGNNFNSALLHTAQNRHTERRVHVLGQTNGAFDGIFGTVEQNVQNAPRR